MPLLEGSEATIAYEQSGEGPDLVWVAGGGSRGGDWRRFQTPFFDHRYRSTTFDGQGIGDTTCELQQPWPIEALRNSACSAASGAQNSNAATRRVTERCMAGRKPAV